MTITPLSTSYANGDTFSASDINTTNAAVNVLSATQSLIAAKGDILTGSADDTLSKTTIGANNTILYADSTQTGGVAWGTITNAMVNASAAIVYSKLSLSNSILNADINASAAIVDTKLATISTAGKVSNSATTATSANTASAIVARDASGEFAATFASFAGRNIGGVEYAPAVTCGAAPTTTSTGILRVGGYTTNSTCITTNNITSSTIYHMAFHSSGAAVGGISSSGSTTSFNTTSDYRLKENVLPLDNALNIIEALQPKQYNFISEPDKKQYGFIAHELAEVIPYAVTGEKDAVDEEGNIRPQQVDYSKLTGLLVAAIQELSDRVKELENK